MENTSRCRLCENVSFRFGSDALERELLRCSKCEYVYVPKNYFLKQDEERERYMRHKNSPDDPDYVAFLRRLLDPLETFLKHGDLVLDYGSGPGAVLRDLLERKGFNVFIYDPHFSVAFPDGMYNAITSTEVFEHFQNPQKELETIISHLERGGLLGVMTERYNKRTTFASWHYTKDPTHVGFFSDVTFAWIEKKYGLERMYDDGERVIVWKKK